MTALIDKLSAANSMRRAASVQSVAPVSDRETKKERDRGKDRCDKSKLTRNRQGVKVDTTAKEPVKMMLLKCVEALMGKGTEVLKYLLRDPTTLLQVSIHPEKNDENGSRMGSRMMRWE